ncbi:MAG: hypothetical protein F6K19_25135 [Cyanothece sp. SIO1E1]|nr:hypothetical protein [Cyanothece sp. SIO1E1]
MQDSQPSNQESDSVLTKLLEVDSDLQTQVAELAVKLEAVQEKRKSLETVIGMFNSVGLVAAQPATQEITQTRETQQTSPTSASVTDSLPSVTDTPTPVKSAPKPKTTKPIKPVTGKRKAKSPKVVEAAGKTRVWEPYMRKDFSEASLPDVVTEILQKQPNKIFEIPAVVSAIFIEDMPREARSKAHNRVSNILSNGAREKHWYRGKSGRYSMSKAVSKS